MRWDEYFTTIHDITDVDELRDKIEVFGAIKSMQAEYVWTEDNYWESNGDNIYSGDDADAAVKTIEQEIDEGIKWYTEDDGSLDSENFENPRPDRIRIYYVMDDGEKLWEFHGESRI